MATVVDVNAPAIQMDAVMVVLGQFPALADCSLTIDTGEIVALTGPNGAGKTTVLRVCAGLVGVRRGSVQVLGEDLVRDSRAVRHRVGVLGHANGLYDDLTAADNVRFWARLAGGTATDATNALRRVALESRLDDVPAGRLSAGQRRRVALAALVARRPELWLLDEPHTGLDADGRELLDGLLRDAVAAGATVVLASHELDRATKLAHRVLSIVGGHATVASAVAQVAQGAQVAAAGEHHVA
jgi:heme ABC exporter ATP-binding subunit CcmA